MYRELDHTVYLVSNGDLTIDYHRFPNGFNTFLWASTARYSAFLVLLRVDKEEGHSN